MSLKSNLDLVNECDNFPYFGPSESQSQSHSQSEGKSYYTFKLDGIPAILGHLPGEIAQRFPITEHWRRDDSRRELVFQPQGQAVDVLEYRNKILADYLQKLREDKVFEVLSGWRNECYPIYGPNHELLLSMERSATPLFGVLTYGIHMTAYVRTAEGMKIWTPKRSPTKQTYPGMMDNTVAGGLSTNEIPFECMLRESMEEASLPEDIARQAKSCGTLTYHYLRDSRAGGETGLSQPECQYIYDLELPADVIPQPNDQEAIDFQALTIDEVRGHLAAGRFKPNCALLLLEFLVRHGIITPENEPSYIEIVSRFHRRILYPTV